MARPRKDGMDYFPHDTDAVNDEKVEALRSIYGNDGYAFYFIMLERIYRTPNFEIDISDAETKEEILQILARKILVTPERFNQMLMTAFKWDCFDRDAYENLGIITSQGIKKRAGIVIEKREFMRKKFSKASNTKDLVSDEKTTPETTQETEEETPQSKVKKSKVKKSKAFIYTLDESEILSFWNSKEIIIHTESEVLKKQIAKALKSFNKEMMILAIDHYSEVLKSDFYYSHKFSLINFLKQGNALPNFLDDGQVWINYLNRKESKEGINTHQGGSYTGKSQRDSKPWESDPYIQLLERNRSQ